MTLRIIFMGTPDFAVPTLQALVAAAHEVAAVYTQPPRPGGRRGLELRPSPVQVAAEEFGLPVFTPTSLKDTDEQERFAAHGADVAVVVAYGLLLPQAVLDAPRHGCFNGHASKLPRWRGAAPIQRAIMAGDRETAMAVMKMEAGLDTGPVALEETVSIDNTTTAGEMHDKLAEIGASLMEKAMAQLEEGTLSLRPQAEDGVEYAGKISKGETRVDWNRPARMVACHINGLSPFPGAWCEMPLGGKPVRVKLLKAEPVEGDGQPGELLDMGLCVACADGVVELTTVQKAGAKAVDGATFLRGHALPAGTIFS